MLAMLNRRQFVTAVRARSTGGSRNRKPVRGAKCLTDSIRPLLLGGSRQLKAVIGLLNEELKAPAIPSSMR